MRLLILSLVGSGTTETLLNAPSGIFGTIIIAGAVIGAIAVIWRKALRPLIRFFKKLVLAIDVLLGLPKWQDDVDERLKDLETKTATPRRAPRPA